MAKERKFYIKGKNLQVMMVYSKITGYLTSAGKYAEKASPGDEIITVERYMELLREFKLNKPSILGTRWDSVLDWLGTFMLSLRPGDSWGPYYQEVGKDLLF